MNLPVYLTFSMGTYDRAGGMGDLASGPHSNLDEAEVALREHLASDQGGQHASIYELREDGCYKVATGTWHWDDEEGKVPEINRLDEPRRVE